MHEKTIDVCMFTLCVKMIFVEHLQEFGNTAGIEFSTKIFHA